MTKRKSIILSLVCLLIAFAIIGILSFNGTAYADETSVPITTKNGAEIRLTEGSTGVRFTWTMSKADYDKLKGREEADGCKVEFGMLIAPKDYNDKVAINEASVFGRTNVYTDRERMDADETQNGKTEIINLHGSSLYFSEKDAEYQFRGVIANIFENNYTRQFIGVGYYSVTVGENTFYVFAENAVCADNARTVAYVADKAMVVNPEEYGDNEILKRFVDVGYENLGLNDEEINTDTEYDALKNLVYGGGRKFTIMPNVSENKYVYAGADFADRKITFSYPAKDNEIENFNHAGTAISAYKGNKNTQNETAEWHESYTDKNGVTKYGVLSLNASNYTQTTSYGNSHNYYLKSSFRNEEFYKDVNIDWDYISVKLLIKSTESGDSSKTVSVWGSEYKLSPTIIHCDEWVEYRFSRSNALEFLSGKRAKDGNTESQQAEGLAARLSVSKNANSTVSIISINSADQKDNMTVYVDSISYEKASYADNVIESFDYANSTTAAYGLNSTKNPEKTQTNDTAVWHSSYEGRDGVVELQSSKYYAASGSYSACEGYLLKSSFRDLTYYATNEDWDYILIWVYVEGKENEKVTIGVSQYLSCSAEINCNEWFELKLFKSNAKSLSSSTKVTINGEEVAGRTQQTVAAWMANSEPSPTISTRAPLIAIATSASEKTTRKIYVDSISYEKNQTNA